METCHHQQQPAATADFTESQKNVRRRVFIATLLGGALAAFAYQMVPSDHFRDLKTPADRLVYTIRLNTLSVGLIFVIVAHIGNTRFATKQINPFGTEDKDRVEVHVRVLQNTIEQFVLSFFSQLAASTWLEPSQMAVIPIVVGLFIVGRLLFWYGYLSPANNRTNRAMGLPLTMFSSFGLLAFNVYKMFTA